MNNILNSFIKWVSLSSSDPNEASLTVKGALILLIPYIIAAEGLTHVNYVDSAALTVIVNDVSLAVYFITGFVGACMTVYGAFRKIYLTIKGQNVSHDIPVGMNAPAPNVSDGQA